MCIRDRDNTVDIYDFAVEFGERTEERTGLLAEEMGSDGAKGMVCLLYTSFFSVNGKYNMRHGHIVIMLCNLPAGKHAVAYCCVYRG